MLESVVTAEGTGKLAAIPGYRVAGQDRHRLEGDRRAATRPIATWRCSAASRRRATPRLAAVVVIDEPSAGQHMGGQVSAPVFSRIVGGALRLLAVAPDQPVNAPEELPAEPGARHRAHGGAAMSRRGSSSPRRAPLAELTAGFVERARRSSR